jgi:hypothetical protein
MVTTETLSHEAPLLESEVATLVPDRQFPRIGRPLNGYFQIVPFAIPDVGARAESKDVLTL